LGFGRVEGSWNNYTAFNVWGGANPENPARFDGKSFGLLSVEGTLYAWWGPGSDNRFAAETRVLRSTDHGKTWMKSEWKFTRGDNIFAGTFLNFGQDYTRARDNYVYVYFPRGSSWAVHRPGRADLARVPKAKIMDRDAYEFFAGWNANGEPTWTSNLAAREPVFEDPNGLRTVSVIYNPGLQRYLLTVDHTERSVGNLGLFEAPQPWGPWRTVAYYTNWNGFTGTISYYFSPKWFSPDGKQFTLIFTQDDSWNTLRGSFSIATQVHNKQ
jgi:hypothetical protein